MPFVGRCKLNQARGVADGAAGLNVEESLAHLGVDLAASFTAPAGNGSSSRP